MISTQAPEKGNPLLWVQLKKAALIALASSKSPEATTFLLNQGLLNSEDLPTRFGSLQALGQLKNNEAVPAIIKLLQDDNTAVKQQAATALGNFDDPQAVTALIGLLQE